MRESIEVSLKRVKEIIESFDEDEFTTAKVIRAYSGNFYCNTGTPPYYSFNAKFGQLLKRKAHELGISKIRKRKAIEDDNGRKTTAAVWRRVTPNSL